MGCPYETEACRKHIHCITCIHYVEPEAIVTKRCKTNADNIRSMSDEELAEWNVVLVRSNKPYYELVYRCSDGYTTDDYRVAIQREIEWLKRPSDFKR